MALHLVVIPVLALAPAYTAKTLCSEIFVAGRDRNEVLADLAIDDLAPLRFVRSEVNDVEGTVTSRLTPFFERRAHYVGELGCTLAAPDHSIDRPRAELGATARPRRAEAILDTVTELPTAARQALDAALDDAFAEPDPARRRRTRAVVVMQHGQIVAERYAEGADVNTPMPGWSMTKSVLNALVGIAVREGKLSLETRANLPQWSGRGDQRARITVNDLLRMSTGLRFEEEAGDPKSDLLDMLYDAPDMAQLPASMPLAAPPGTVWKYSTGTSVILSRVLRNALGDSAYRTFPRDALFEPLGLTHAVIEADATGTFVASSYMYATAREWARFGQLYLQDGVWMGERILPDGWVEYTRTPAPAAPPATYGAHFWLTTAREYSGPPADVPADAYHATGHEGQFITIVPSRNAVIVRLGRTRYPDAWAHDRFIAAVLTALPQ